jgi:uncharacterized membrane protein YdbT with pleckstrin-like domain
MEKSIKPDRKYFTKCFWIHLTITGTALLVLAITNLIIHFTGGDPYAISLLWLIGSLCIILFWVISYPITYLWIKNLHYIVREDRVTIHKGILTKTQQNIPLRAVTDFALQRTIYDRILGIGSIKIQTAGQTKSPTGYEGALSGLLDYDNWQGELRQKIENLHPLSEATAATGMGNRLDEGLLTQILDELKKIRTSLENK